MGQSTDAILFYGFHADKDDWDEFTGDDWEATFAGKKGLHRPVEEYTDETKEQHRAYWAAQRELVKAEPCKLDSHCSGECPMPFVCVKASATRARRGYPEQIQTLEVKPEWEAQLRAFCELMGIPWQEPRWWLVSDWN